ncbi:MAG TPA: hypothetical protein VMT87_07340 [Vicinamibacteria bacterium]|nr:hypothetical protein [Vicinamibacteria bacterium]
MIPRTVTAALLVALLAAPGRAEDASAASLLVAEGARVRLLAPSVVDGLFKGTVLSSDADVLVVEMDRHVRVRVPRSAITRVEVGEERRRRTWHGLIIGAVVLGALGGTADVPEDCARLRTQGSACFDSRGDAVAGGILVGAALGAFVGHRMQSETWRPVPVSAVQVSVGPLPGGGVRATLAVSF